MELEVEPSGLLRFCFLYSEPIQQVISGPAIWSSFSMKGKMNGIVSYPRTPISNLQVRRRAVLLVFVLPGHTY